jgi:hypothetical protein
LRDHERIMPPTNQNQLSVDLVVNNLPAANADINKFVDNAKSGAAEITKAGDLIGTSFDKAANAIIHQTANIRQQLTQISQVSKGVVGFDGLAKAADRSYIQLGSVYTRLKEIQAQAATTSDPVILKKLQADALAAGAELDALQRKIDRVGAGRKAALDRAQAAQPGAGPSKLGNAAGLAAQFLPPELFQGIQAVQLATSVVGAGAAVAVGTLAAGAVAAVAVTSKLKSDAEARLVTENEISGAINRQVAALKEAYADYDRFKQKYADDKTFSKKLDDLINSGSTSAIAAVKSQADADNKKTLAEIGKVTADQTTNQFLLDASKNRATSGSFTPSDKQQDIAARTAALAKNAKDLELLNAKLSDGQQRFIQADKAIDQVEKNDEARRAANFQNETRRQQALAENRDKGIAKVQELAKADKDLFDSLFAAAGAENPFVKVFSDADAAILKTTITTRGLNDELKNTAQNLTATANANKLFATRLDSELKADDLRTTADKFRNADDKPFIDPKILATPGGFEQFAFNQFRDLNLAGNGGGVNSDSLLSELARQKVAAQSGENGTVQQRFDRQLSIIQKASGDAQNEQQRQEADRRLLALGGNLDPSKLNATQRDAIASAAEREAVRTENQEKDAKAQRDTQAKVIANLDTNLAALLGIAQSDGLTGVIRIINEAENRADVTLGKRPNDDDVAKENQR